jgi:hypothetical protein
MWFFLQGLIRRRIQNPLAMDAEPVSSYRGRAAFGWVATQVIVEFRKHH